MQRIFLTLATAMGLSLASGATALAADVARPTYKAPPPVAVAAYNWTGFHVGIHAGYAWGDWAGDLTFDPVVGRCLFSTQLIEQSTPTAGFLAARSDLTIRSTTLYLALKPTLRGRTSRAAITSPRSMALRRPNLNEAGEG